MDQGLGGLARKEAGGMGRGRGRGRGRGASKAKGKHGNGEFEGGGRALEPCHHPRTLDKSPTLLGPQFPHL